MTSTIQKNITDILQAIGEDPTRPGLKETPKRFAAALQYLTAGYQDNLDVLVNGATFPSTMNEMIIVKDVELYSLCEHHLLPFFGKCHVAYLPNKKILGLSKIARIVDMFARRLQIQEHLTQSIAESIAEVTDAKGVAVIIEAKHLCMMMRGVEKQNSSMTTSVMLGVFRADHRTRAEFLSLIKKG